jgi:hypothetical protein
VVRNFCKAFSWEALKGRFSQKPLYLAPKPGELLRPPVYFLRGEKIRGFETSYIMRDNIMPSGAKTDVEIILGQGILFRCLDWGNSGCHPAIKQFFDLEKQSKTRRLPTLDELNRFNEICRRCRKAYLEIYKKECPACGSSYIVEGFVTRPNNNADERPHVIYPYYCTACGKYLFSGVEL